MGEALSVADVLDRAADLIEPEGAWTQGCFARRDDGMPAVVDAKDATCFCARGAIMRVQGSGTYTSAAEVFFAHHGLGRNNGYIALSIVNWNDTAGRTQAQVIAKLREAASLARGTQQ